MVRGDLQVVRGQFAIGTRTHEQLQTGTLGCCGFVDVDVRPLGTHDTVAGTGKGTEGRDVAARAAEHEETLRTGTEEPLELGVNLERNVVVAVGAGMADVRSSESLDDRWMRAGKVVAGEGSKRAHRSILTSTSVIDA